MAYQSCMGDSLHVLQYVKVAAGTCGDKEVAGGRTKGHSRVAKIPSFLASKDLRAVNGLSQRALIDFSASPWQTCVFTRRDGRSIAEEFNAALLCRPIRS